MNKKKISRGYAVGLSSHSSMKNSSEIFKKSEIFELSSINQNSDSIRISKNISDLSLVHCRFCGRKNERENLVRVCRCEARFSGHPSCVKFQTDAKCKKCNFRWITEEINRKNSLEIMNLSSSRILLQRTLQNPHRGG